MYVSDLVQQLRKCRNEAGTIKAGGDVEVYFITPDGTLHSIDNVKFSEVNAGGLRIICSEEEP